MGQWIADNSIDAICVNPVLVSSLEAAGSLPHLRLCLLVGGKLSRDQAVRLRKCARAARLLNIYGSTETQRAVSFFEVPAATQDIEGCHPSFRLELV